MFAAFGRVRKQERHDECSSSTLENRGHLNLPECSSAVILTQNSCIQQKKEKKSTKKAQLWFKLMKVSSHLCLLQAMIWAAQRTARCTPTGTSGSRHHAGSACVTTVRSCVMRSCVKRWLTVRRWWSLRESAALCVRRTHPPAVEQAPLVSKKDSSVGLH